jgi:hypothetical protein
MKRQRYYSNEVNQYIEYQTSRLGDGTFLGHLPQNKKPCSYMDKNIKTILSIVFNKIHICISSTFILYDLPDSISDLIFGYLPKEMVVPLMFICKESNAYASDPIRIHDTKYLLRKFNKNFAVPSGNKELVNWTISYLEYPISNNNDNLCLKAAKNNHFELLKWLYNEKSCKLFNKAIYHSIKTDNLEMFKWLRIQGLELPKKAIIYASFYSLCILKEVIDNDDNNDTLKTLKKGKIWNVSFKEDCLKNAAVANNFEILNYLIKDGDFVIHARILLYLLKGRHYEIIKYIIKTCDKIECEAKNPFDTRIGDVFFFLGLSGDKELVIIINKNKKIEIDADSLIAGAIGSGNLEFVKWLIDEFNISNIKIQKVIKGLYELNQKQYDDIYDIIEWIIDKGYIQYIDINLLELSIVSIKNNYMKLFRLMLNKYKEKPFGINNSLNYELLIERAIFNGNIEALDIIANIDSIEVFKLLETFKDRNMFNCVISSNKKEILDWLANNGITLNPRRILNLLTCNITGDRSDTEILDLIYDIDKTVIDTAIKVFNKHDDDNRNEINNPIYNDDNDIDRFYNNKSIIEFGNEKILMWLESHNYSIDKKKLWNCALRDGQYKVIKWIYENCKDSLSFCNEDTMIIAISSNNIKTVKFVHNTKMFKRYIHPQKTDAINAAIITQNLTVFNWLLERGYACDEDSYRLSRYVGNNMIYRSFKELQLSDFILEINCYNLQGSGGSKLGLSATRHQIKLDYVNNKSKIPDILIETGCPAPPSQEKAQSAGEEEEEEQEEKEEEEEEKGVYQSEKYKQIEKLYNQIKSKNSRALNIIRIEDL